MEWEYTKRGSNKKSQRISKNISNNKQEQEKLDKTMSKEDEFDSEGLHRGGG